MFIAVLTEQTPTAIQDCDSGFLGLGADLQWLLACFKQAEILYPPLSAANKTE